MQRADPPEPIQRNGFDRWLWDRGYTNAYAGENLRCHAQSVWRYRLPFGHADRRIPDEQIIARIVEWTDGAVTAADFYPPHLNGDRPGDVAVLSAARAS